MIRNKLSTGIILCFAFSVLLHQWLVKWSAEEQLTSTQYLSASAWRLILAMLITNSDHASGDSSSEVFFPSRTSFILFFFFFKLIGFVLLSSLRQKIRADLAFGYNIRLYTIEPLFSVFTSHVIKPKMLTLQCLKSRIWDTIDEWHINNLAKTQLPVVFNSCVICRTVSPKFVELWMETPCLCPSEGH